jgi:hypothetical protein
VFSSHIRGVVTDALTSGSPAVPADVAGTAGHLVASGAIDRAVAVVPPGSRATLVVAARQGVVGSVNNILLIGAILSFVAAVACFFLVRTQDFVDSTIDTDAPASAPAAAV